MKFDPQKSFGYPVLRPGSSDYTKGSFQPSVGLHVSEDIPNTYVVSYQFAIGVKELSDLIDDGLANYVLVISCNSTIFQKVVVAEEFEGEVQIDADEVREAIEISPYLVANQDISGYSADLINPEFGKSDFDVQAGAVIACAEPTVYYVERDVFKNISSIFDYVIQPSLSLGEWRLKLDEDRVKILISKKQMEVLRTAENTTQNQWIITNSIFLPAVVEMVSTVSENEDFDDYRWASVIKGKCALLSIDLQSNPDSIEVAQKLMNLPLSLLNDSAFAGDEQ